MAIKVTSGLLLNGDERETLTTVFNNLARRGRLLRVDSIENDFVVKINLQEEPRSGEKRAAQSKAYE